MHLKYASYVFHHKWFVFLAGRKTRAPLWRLVIHDWSKFTLAEWSPYARRFYGGSAGVEDKSHDPEEFHRAWTHHWHLNPHHWNHWLAINGDQTLKPLCMPEHFVREMVADWMGAGRAITGTWDMQAWFTDTAPRMVLHPDTRELVNQLVQTHAGVKL